MRVPRELAGTLPKKGMTQSNMKKTLKETSTDKQHTVQCVPKCDNIITFTEADLRSKEILGDIIKYVQCKKCKTLLPVHISKSSMLKLAIM